MWCAVYCLCLLLIGLGAVEVLLPRAHAESPFLRFGFAACLGPGLMGFGLIAFSILGSLPSRPLIFCMTAPLALLTGISAWRSPRRYPLAAGWLKQAPAWFTIICLLAIAYGIVVVAWYALTVPVIVGDAFSIWQLKAKVLATHPLFPRPDYFFDVSLSYSHLRYPILVPMISAGVNVMTGRIDTDLVKVPFLLSYIGL